MNRGTPGETVCARAITWMENLIAVEMMALINTHKYVQIIPALPAGAGPSEKIFHKTMWSMKYFLDTDRWLDGSFMNPNAMFELFGKFNCETPLQVRKHMLKFL